MTANIRLRLAIVGIVVFSLFATMVARLWYLQVLDSEELQAAATQNQVRVVFDAAPRGRILDRQGRPLVDARGTQAVTVKRQDIEKDPEAVNRLAALLGVPIDEMKRRIADPRFSIYRPVPVAERVSEEIVVRLRERAHEFPGVAAAAVSERVYPHGPLAAHVLGYVGEINDRELADGKAKGYRLGDDIGKAGVEQTYEEDLRGQPGSTELEVDSKGDVLRPLAKHSPVSGKDLQLTIDLDVQRLTEESLAQGLDAARKREDRDRGGLFTAPAGAAVVLDPRDGSVLAMASFPTYDPSAFVNGIKPELFQALQSPGSFFPLTNRAIQGQYAPGSTFKLFTALAGLQTDAIKPNTTFMDDGVFELSNCRGDKCSWQNAGGVRYGRVNVTNALTVSSDVFFYTLGANFWFQGGPKSQAIQAAARQLGLGEKTGIPLSGEQRGRIPDPVSRKKLNESNPKAYPNGGWYAGDNVNLAIGQGEIVVTPLQLANSYATFANGGTSFVPRVAARVLGSDGRTIREVPTTGARRVPLPAHLRQPILLGLKGAVADPKGTAAGAFVDFPLAAFPVAGKTGTAQVSGKHDTSVFVAFAPADNAQYVVAVVMEEAGFGGSAAAPVARRILDGLAGSPPGPVRSVGAID